jgi:integrase
MFLTPVSELSLFIPVGTSSGPGASNEAFERFVKNIFANMPVNSQKAVRSDWNCYMRFIKANNGIAAVPATEGLAYQTMIGYVYYLRERFMVKTIRRRLHHLKVLFSYFGCPNPLMTSHELKKSISLVIKKVAKPAGQAEPLSADLLKAHTDKVDLSNLKALRDTMIVNLAYDSLCRSAELRVIRLDHVTKNDDGTGTVFVERTKSDREAIGSFRFISKTTMTLIKSWLDVTGIKEGYLLRAVTSAGTLKPYLATEIAPLSYDAVVGAFRAVNVNLTGHSARVGAAVDMVKQGISLEKIQLAGGWRDPGMILFYARKTAAEHSAAADMAKVMGR